MKILAVLLFAVLPLFAENAPNAPTKGAFSNFITGGCSLLGVSVEPIHCLSIATKGGYISINFDGTVDLPKDTKLNTVALAFWKAVVDTYPEVRKAILAGNQYMQGITPAQIIEAAQSDLTTTWAADIKGTAQYELGFRSDGVVVWRKVSP